MTKSTHNLTRRVFLKQTATATLFAGFGSLANSPALKAQKKSKNRRNLSEPGPMIPPVPAILLTVNGHSEGQDEISVVWTFVVNGNPPQIGVSVHEEHVALQMIKKHRQFVLNVPTVETVEAFDIVDMNSSKIMDKYALTGLTRGKAVKVDAPTVEESPIHVECRVFNTLEVPPVRTIFLAEVVATTVHEGVCDENGRLIVSSVPFFGMIAGSGEFYTMGEMVGHIGKSVGRDDIKY